MAKTKGQRRKALSQPKKKRKYAVARGCATFKSPPPAKECPEDDEPIVNLGSKKKKLKTAQKPNSIQDMLQCPDKDDPVQEEVSPVQDVSRRNKSTDEDESSVDNKSQSQSKDEDKPIEDLSCPQDNDESKDEDDDPLSRVVMPTLAKRGTVVNSSDDDSEADSDSEDLPRRPIARKKNKPVTEGASKEDVTPATSPATAAAVTATNATAATDTAAAATTTQEPIIIRPAPLSRYRMKNITINKKHTSSLCP
jgi:hypothetical protein